MKTQTSATLMLAVTLLAGVALGALGQGALAERRNRARTELARPGGFVSHMEETLRPRDEDQRARIHAALEAGDARNRAIVDSAQEQLRAELSRLRSELEPMLDPDQLQRLDDVLRRPPPGPPPGLGEPGRRGPPGERRGAPPAR